MATTANADLLRQAEINQLVQRADQGDAVAQFEIGYMYHNGLDTSVDYARALKWYELSAAQGYAPAVFNLGLLYYNGQGVPQNFKTALNLFLQAAGSPDATGARAKYQIGIMCFNGQGTNKNRQRALKWHQDAINSGSYEALAEFARLYEIGYRPKETIDNALKYYVSAAKAGDKDAAYRAAVIYESMTGSKNKEKAQKFYKMAGVKN